ncbi:MAG: hypothetical protein MR902_00100 [Campylobacter sp.]|nr:hypothetical protein [Campylobacter sp.]
MEKSNLKQQKLDKFVGMLDGKTRTKPTLIEAKNNLIKKDLGIDMSEVLQSLNRGDFKMVLLNLIIQEKLSLQSIFKIINKIKI